MEITGLQRMVKLMEKWSLEIGVIIIDRHRQIATWIREKMESTRHCYGIWHIEKCRDNFENVPI